MCFLLADLTQANLYMSLARPQVMTNVVKIVKENIPEVNLLLFSIPDVNTKSF